MLYQFTYRHSGYLTSTPIVRGGSATAATLGNYADQNPASLVVCTSTSILLEWDLGSALAPAFAALIHHNVKDSTAIYALAHSSPNDWASGSVLFYPFTRTASSVFVPYGTYRPNAWVSFSGPARRYWALGIGISGSDFNDVNIKFGEFFLQAGVNTFTHNPSWGMRQELVLPPGQTTNETRMGVRWTTTVLGSRRRWSGVVETTSTFADQLRSLYQTCLNGALPFLLIPDPAVYDCALVHWDKFEKTFVDAPNNETLSFSFLEAANGPELLL
jgi:hypothetical protein